jgi:hypothetical protein
MRLKIYSEIFHQFHCRQLFSRMIALQGASTWAVINLAAATSCLTAAAFDLMISTAEDSKVLLISQVIFVQYVTSPAHLYLW